jgi:creatinine amidohydrolase
MRNAWVIAVVVGALVAAAYGACVEASTAAAEAADVAEPEAPAASRPAARQGYSIFRETMVDLTWPQVKEAAGRKALVLVPLGVIEEHGPHMSLGPDTYQSVQRCLLLKHELAGRHVEAVIAPPIYWGVMAANETGAYPGSFTVSPATMKALLGDVFADLRSWGFDTVYVVNHHGDRTHRRTLAEAIEDAKARLGLRFYNDREREDAARGPELKLPAGFTPFTPDFHAGLSETAEMAAFFPEEVDLSVVATLEPQATFQPRGYVGDPASSPKVAARAFVESEMAFAAECVARWVREPGDPASRGTTER